MPLLSLTVKNAVKWSNSGEEIGLDISKLEEDKELVNALSGDTKKLLKMIEDTKLTCGNCQLICWGDPKETKENFKILINSGCVIQKENGEISVLPTDKAKKEFEKMNLKHQKLYCRELKHL